MDKRDVSESSVRELAAGQCFHNWHSRWSQSLQCCRWDGFASTTVTCPNKLPKNRQYTASTMCNSHTSASFDGVSSAQRARSKRQWQWALVQSTPWRQKALTCPQGQSAWALAPPWLAKEIRSMRKIIDQGTPPRSLAAWSEVVTLSMGVLWETLVAVFWDECAGCGCFGVLGDRIGDEIKFTIAKCATSPFVTKWLYESRTAKSASDVSRRSGTCHTAVGMSPSLQIPQNQKKHQKNQNKKYIYKKPLSHYKNFLSKQKIKEKKGLQRVVYHRDGSKKQFFSYGNVTRNRAAIVAKKIRFLGTQKRRRKSKEKWWRMKKNEKMTKWKKMKNWKKWKM